LRLLEASPLTYIEALLDGIEEIETIWYYIRGTKQMRHSYELFIEKNCVIAFELWSLHHLYRGKNVFVIIFPWKARAMTLQKYLMLNDIQVGVLRQWAAGQSKVRRTLLFGLPGTRRSTCRLSQKCR
jgi:hypothetical protein